MNREIFTLHRVLQGELCYSEFEEILTLFVKALRYWKEWIAFASQNGNNVTSDSIKNNFQDQGLLV